MNYTEHYHDWLRDAHAMEKQAESMLESMASRIENYPDIKARIEQHISETKHQITMLEEVLDRNGISRSVLKDSMSKMAAMGQSIGGMFPSDEIVKGSISGYVFEQFEIACYTSLLAAAKKAGDTASIPTIEAILKEEMQMADWLIKHIPQTRNNFYCDLKQMALKPKNK
ncbi:ferritin-like domain-containing protein [Salmonella enterica]|nr:ferritin-like domain-containing protein [Salmonella enterica]